MISRRKPGVLRDLTKRLREIGVAKTKQKERHKAAMEETCRYEIRINTEVEKKRLGVEKELGVWRLALKERQQAFWEKIAFEGKQWGAALDGIPNI